MADDSPRGTCRHCGRWVILRPNSRLPFAHKYLLRDNPVTGEPGGFIPCPGSKLPTLSGGTSGN